MVRENGMVMISEKEAEEYVIKIINESTVS